MIRTLQNMSMETVWLSNHCLPNIIAFMAYRHPVDDSQIALDLNITIVRTPNNLCLRRQSIVATLHYKKEPLFPRIVCLEPVCNPRQWRSRLSIPSSLAPSLHLLEASFWVMEPIRLICLYLGTASAMLPSVCDFSFPVLGQS